MISELLTTGRRWTFVGGKGGVGKTTAAAALAVSLADAGDSVLVLSIDPAHSLGDALGVRLASEPAPVPGVPGLTAMEVDAEGERAAFLDVHRDDLSALIEGGTYLDRDDIDGVLGLALPGVDELAALLRLMRLADAEQNGTRVVIDTAPTGHTLRLLELPQVAQRWLDALGAIEAKRFAVSEALTGRRHSDAAGSGWLRELEADLDRISSLLADPVQTRFVLVTTPEPAVLTETRRYRDALEEQAVALGGVVVNRSGATAPGPESLPSGAALALAPLLPTDPQGVKALRDFAAAVQRAPADNLPPAFPSAGDRLAIGAAYRPPADRNLYLVGGKGGVGKTTVASALAMHLADETEGTVLLLSTDPAGSLGDVFGVPAGSVPTPVADAPGLLLQQIDAVAAWDAFRARYSEPAEALLAGLASGGTSAALDQRVLSGLLGAAPPGVDELMALIEVVDLEEGTAYNALILDTAPTGHLLRLLEMPRVGLDWAHALLRILLKYREVIGLGELAERTLAFARSLRALRHRLEDRTRTAVVVVALPEALSVPETERLLPRLAVLGLGAEALVVNRLFTPAGEIPAGRECYAAMLFRAGADSTNVGAPEWEQGPQGAGELRRFAQSWRRVHPA